MERKPLQLDLELPRRRAAWKDDTELVGLRLSAEAARIVIEDPLARRPGEMITDAVKRRESVQRELDVDDSFVWADIGYTPWLTDAPPCSGFWEIRQKSARMTTTHQRPWYDAPTKLWMARGWWVAPIPHSMLVMSHFWRGLKAPCPGGYAYKVPGQRVRFPE